MGQGSLLVWALVFLPWMIAVLLDLAREPRDKRWLIFAVGLVVLASLIGGRLVESGGRAAMVSLLGWIVLATMGGKWRSERRSPPCLAVLGRCERVPAAQLPPRSRGIEPARPLARPTDDRQDAMAAHRGLDGASRRGGSGMVRLRPAHDGPRRGDFHQQGSQLGHGGGLASTRRADPPVLAPPARPAFGRQGDTAGRGRRAERPRRLLEELSPPRGRSPEPVGPLRRRPCRVAGGQAGLDYRRGRGVAGRDVLRGRPRRLAKLWGAAHRFGRGNERSCGRGLLDAG